MELEDTISQETPPADYGTGQAYLLFVVSLLLIVTVGLTLQMTSPSIGLVLTELLLILWPAVAYVRRKGLPVAEALRLRPISVTDALLSIGIGATVWAVAMGIYAIVSSAIGESPNIQSFESENIGQLLLLLVVVALLPGICEELLFRGAIQGILERRGKTAGVVITAILFGIYHLDPWRLLPIIFLGLVLGTLAVRTGSVIPAILGHISSNAAAVTTDYLLGDEIENATFLYYALVPSFAVFAALFWLTTRGRPVAPSPLETVPAGVSSGARYALWGAAAIGGFMMIAATVGIVTLIEMQKVQWDELAPHLREGDQVVIARDPSGERSLREGDVVSYRPAESEKNTLGRVLRTEADRVWIATPDGELELERNEIVGKVVYPEPPE